MPSNHLDSQGQARMVDVSQKEVTARVAIAEGQMRMRLETADEIRAGTNKKGDVLQIARLAAIGGVKQTAHWIPLCHPLPVEGVDVEFLWLEPAFLALRVTVRTTGKTGVEMEALTGVAAGLLTIYDMMKSVERGLVIGPMYLVEKRGGASGHFVRNQE